MDEIAAVVKSAATLADQVIVTIHAHEGGRTRLEPAEFLVTFAHAMIDAGADLFVGHGPHVLRGIEIYKGAPILYSLGDFIFQNETLLRYPADNYDEQQLGPGGHARRLPQPPLQLRQVGLPGRPADLGVGGGDAALPRRPARRAGAPPDLAGSRRRAPGARPADAGVAGAGTKILNDLTTLSAPFGTRISVRDGVGYVELQAAASQP